MIISFLIVSDHAELKVKLKISYFSIMQVSEIHTTLWYLHRVDMRAHAFNQVSLAPVITLNSQLSRESRSLCLPSLTLNLLKMRKYRDNYCFFFFRLAFLYLYIFHVWPPFYLLLIDLSFSFCRFASIDPKNTNLFKFRFSFFSRSSKFICCPAATMSKLSWSYRYRSFASLRRIH